MAPRGKDGSGVPGHPKFDPMAKYGVPMNEWLTLTLKERDDHYKRIWRKRNCKGSVQKFDPSLYGLTMEEWQALTPRERNRYQCRLVYRRTRLLHPERLTAKWRKAHGTQKSRERDRARYWADPEKRRKQAREAYWRHHEEQLARGRARYAKQKSISSVRHDPDRIYRLVLSAVPSRLPRFARDDIAGMICLAVLEGKLLVDDIEKEVASFLRSYNREYDTFKSVSLDAPIPGMDGMTYMDRLSGSTEDERQT